MVLPPFIGFFSNVLICGMRLRFKQERVNTMVKMNINVISFWFVCCIGVEEACR